MASAGVWRHRKRMAARISAGVMLQQRKRSLAINRWRSAFLANALVISWRGVIGENNGVSAYQYGEKRINEISKYQWLAQ